MALKIGAENKRNVYIAGALGLVVLVLVIRMLLGSSPVPVSQVAPSPATARPATGTESHTATKLPANGGSLDPTLHPELMEQAESLEYTGTGRNIFSLNSAPVEIPKPIASARAQAQAASAPTGPPPPPAIDLKFFGYSSRKSGLRHAFLLKGEDVFIASEGDVVDHRYKVVKIAPMSVQVEDIPFSNTQSLPLIAN